MRLRYLLIALVTLLLAVCSCSDDDSFTTSRSNLLYFSMDTVKLDTIFSNVPTHTKSFWVYNHSGDGIRCTNIRLEHGNQTGFRVNVDGTYLGPTNGYQINQVEIRNKDSIRVFVELTSSTTFKETPQLLQDNLLFSLESGVQQRVNLKAYSWDATLVVDYLKISRDTLLSTTKPLVVYKGIVVEEGATLTIGAGTTIYFHNDAGIDVFGRLVCNGTPEANVILRGDRIDRMFDYLPYDNVSGQWQGIRINESSYDNVLQYTDIHSTYNGISIDSCDIERSTLQMVNSTVHNCQGYGILANHCQASFVNCQITNTLCDCMSVVGGRTTINGCTLAQFYPFDSNRGVALRFSSNPYPLVDFLCQNTLITGYADDEMMAEKVDSVDFHFLFKHCIIRTPVITTDDSLYFENVIFEDIEDTISSGRKHFVKIDIDKQQYDFHLDSVSCAIGKADAVTSMPLDRDGNMRDNEPDIGCFEFRKQQKP